MLEAVDLFFGDQTYSIPPFRTKNSLSLHQLTTDNEDTWGLLSDDLSLLNFMEKCSAMVFCIGHVIGRFEKNLVRSRNEIISEWK